MGPKTFEFERGFSRGAIEFCDKSCWKNENKRISDCPLYQIAGLSSWQEFSDLVAQDKLENKSQKTLPFDNN